MLDIDSFSNAVALIYDASMDVERWNDALAFVAGLFAAEKAQISFATSLVDAHPFVRLFGFSEEDLRIMPRYSELASRDPRLTTIRFKAMHCRQLVSDEVLHASEMYREALAPAGVEYAMYFTLGLEEEALCVVSVMRGPQGEPFTDDDCKDLGQFVPHVQRAVTLHGTFYRVRREISAARAAIDSVPFGMLVLDDDRVVLANQAARSLLEEGDALKCHNGQLRATSPQADAKLSSAIREARDGGVKPVGVVLPAGDDDQIRAVVRSLHSSSANMLGVQTEAVALYLSDSRRPLETPGEILQQLFGLTGREAAVLRALVQGDDTQGLAKRFSIGPETVKTHIQHIMRATGVSRQAELIQLVLSSPAWMAAQNNNNKSRSSSNRPSLLKE